MVSFKTSTLSLVALALSSSVIAHPSGSSFYARDLDARSAYLDEANLHLRDLYDFEARDFDFDMERRAPDYDFDLAQRDFDDDFQFARRDFGGLSARELALEARDIDLVARNYEIATRDLERAVRRAGIVGSLVGAVKTAATVANKYAPSIMKTADNLNGIKNSVQGTTASTASGT